jgi:hypothetical protein
MKHLILALAVGILLLTLTIELLRRRSLREEYAWPWLSLGIVMLVLALWPGLLHFVGEALQPTVTISALLLFVLVFTLLANIRLSVQVSKLSRQVETLSQKVGILDYELEQASSGEGGTTSRESTAEGATADREEI